jgi:hypothetical protein
MVFPFALLCALLFHRRRRPFVGHLVFSLHFYTFLLLLFTIAVSLAGVDLLLGGAGLKSSTYDHVLSVIQVVACSIYLYLATGVVYAAHGFMRIFQTALLVAAVVAIVLGYRFSLLLFTLYST